MLLIDHTIAPSPIHGLGVFAAVAVAKGTPVWAFNPLIDRMIPAAMLAALPPHVRAMVKRLADYYPDWGCYVLGGDGDYFMNHSDAPNVVPGPGGGHRGHAAHDIAAGEELTCDYRQGKGGGASAPRPAVTA